MKPEGSKEGALWIPEEAVFQVEKTGQGSTGAGNRLLEQKQQTESQCSWNRAQK